MSNTRKNPIYGNCSVLAPDGKLMFRCLDRRAKWYLKKNLAVVISDNPLVVQLTFQPKGNGEPLEILKIERYNRCVVCGETDLGVLTRHHLVPIEYRQYFPESKKRHNSILVVSICQKCHQHYEHHYAQPLKKELTAKHGLPISGGIYAMKWKLSRMLNALKEHSREIPEDRKEIMRKNILSMLVSFGINEVTLSSDEEINSLCKMVDSLQISEDETHGKLLVSKYPVLEDFERLWVDHFIQFMKPQYMGEYMNDFSGLLDVFNGSGKRA